MWLPAPVYERIPQFWFLLGLLFVVNGLYLGLYIPVSLVYIAIGFVCCAYGVGVAVIRFKNRRDRQKSGDSTSANE